MIAQQGNPADSLHSRLIFVLVRQANLVLLTRCKSLWGKV